MKSFRRIHFRGNHFIKMFLLGNLPLKNLKPKMAIKLESKLLFQRFYQTCESNRLRFFKSNRSEPNHGSGFCSKLMGSYAREKQNRKSGNNVRIVKFEVKTENGATTKQKHRTSAWLETQTEPTKRSASKSDFRLIGPRVE